MSFVQRKLKSTFVLGTGNFGLQGQNQLELSGLRTTSDVIYAGGLGVGTLDLAIYGMTLSHMNQLSTLGMVYSEVRRNSITLDAGDDKNGMATVFQGIILNAWPDMNAMPNVPFRITAMAQLLTAVAPSSVVNVKGSADAATLLAGLALKMNPPCRFENNGVSVKLQNPYYDGSAFNQAQQIVRHAGIEWNSCEKGILAIWKPGQTRGGTTIILSKDTGMVGYPTATSNGLSVRTIWNPSISLGTRIQVKTTLKLAAGSGEFSVYKIDHHLDAYTPNGRWFSDIQSTPPALMQTP
jgi:hypothetical protein